MLAVDRRKKITELIQQNKSVLVADLSKLFAVTEETIRRDLDKLEQQGILTKTYGGATLTEDSTMELPVEMRQTINAEGKDRIGKEAAKLIREGETIFLDASTSSLHVARHIKDKTGITVITNAEKVVMELSSSQGLNVICIGGILRSTSLSYVGRVTENTILQNYYANKAFISCRGVTLNRGLTDSNEQEAEVKKAMMACSETVVFLCDKSKFGKIGFPVLAPLENINYFITDIVMEKEWQEELARKNINVKVAKEYVL